jgi:UDP-N-acetylmuramate--alanine ligase
MNSNPISALPAMRRIRYIHFVGIGGVGMSGIAEVLHKLGYVISGSDQKASGQTQRLQKMGIQVFIGHAAENAKHADVVVVSSAISAENPEVVLAIERRVPVIPRAQMLGELMRFHYGIAITGTHGKTTTTSLVASIFAEANRDPTFVVGGKLNSADTNARLGEGRYFICEADESDASFLYLQPLVSIVTNIDADHMATYGHDFNRLRQVFIDFLHRLPFYGLAVLCIDDPVIAEILSQVSRPMITYGFSESAAVRAVDYQQIGLQSKFTVQFTEEKFNFPVTLNLPGKHNALNALAAIAVARDCGISVQEICNALSQFAGIGRRCQVHGELSLPQGGSVTVVDDYGHHPREIAATLAAVKAAWPGRRLVLLYQPHRYSRTQELFDDFVEVFSTVEVVLLAEVYAAGETPIAGADSRALCRGVRQRGRVEPVYLKDVEAAFGVLPDLLQPNDVLLIQGAGDIGKLPALLMEQGLKLKGLQS